MGVDQHSIVRDVETHKQMGEKHFQCHLRNPGAQEHT